jgi:hypothetical protein
VRASKAATGHVLQSLANAGKLLQSYEDSDGRQ